MGMNPRILSYYLEFHVFMIDSSLVVIQLL